MIKKLLIAVVVLIACPVAALLAYNIFVTYVGEVTLENQANESIDQATIVICKQKFDLGNLEPGANKAAKYEVRGDSHYDVSIRFHSGRQINSQVGYVTRGFDFNDKLIVRADEVILESSHHLR